MKDGEADNKGKGREGKKDYGCKQEELLKQ